MVRDLDAVQRQGDVEFDHSGKNTEYAEFEYSGS
jgi:hypothetical protein